MQLVIVLAIVTLLVGMICLIDLWNKKCSVMRRLLWSPVPFIPLLGPLLYYALFDPPSVQRKDVPIPKNAIEQWKEWLNNRYNPGYFTGGQIHPEYRAVGPRVGILFLISGIVGIGFVLLTMRSEGAEDSTVMFLFEAIISIIMIFAGLTRIAEGRKKRKE